MGVVLSRIHWLLSLRAHPKRYLLKNSNVCHQPSDIKRKCPQVGGANGKNDNDNTSLCSDFIFENIMNIMSITVAGNLNFSAHEDKIFRDTVDFIWSA